MTATTHALISLEVRFAEGILNSTKRVELRRRPMRLSVGATIWLYVKVPVGKVIGSVEVRSFQALAPSTLWRRYGDVSGLCRREFFDYSEMSSAALFSCSATQQGFQSRFLWTNCVC